MLSQLLPEISLTSDVSITGITDDSRRLRKGDLFLAITGSRIDARKFIPGAARDLAAAIVCDPPYGHEFEHHIQVLAFDNLAQSRGDIASRFYDNPSAAMKVIAITGTNGKTSCSQFMAAAMSSLGKRCAIVGTMGSGLYSELSGEGLTTPDAISLQSLFAEFRDKNVDVVCMEASSHGLEQGRLVGTDVNIAVFTNITRDHLDYHNSFDAYKAAKLSLFEMNIDAAVINLDDEFGNELSQKINRDIKVLSYSLDKPDADISCIDLAFSAEGFSATLDSPWGEVQISSGLLGGFNVSNLLAVTAVLGRQGFSAAEISTSVSDLTNIRGRMDVLRNNDVALVIIDYAHTPDALEKTLVAIKLHCSKDVWCIVGCGGDRDRGKRPEMAEISTRLAEHTILTDDNPRFESSEQIINDMKKGIRTEASCKVIPDRREAIAFALCNAGEHDLVLIAGKGHEEYQEIAGRRLPFSDYAVVDEFVGMQRDRREA